MKKLVSLLFVSAFFLVIAGTLFKIMHYASADMLLGAGLLLTLVYTVIALYEIHGSRKLPVSEKVMWTIGFLFLNTVTGLLYILMGRKRVVR
jgi:hypothetical protein